MGVGTAPPEDVPDLPGEDLVQSIILPGPLDSDGDGAQDVVFGPDFAQAGRPASAEATAPAPSSTTALRSPPVPGAATPAAAVQGAANLTG